MGAGGGVRGKADHGDWGVGGGANVPAENPPRGRSVRAGLATRQGRGRGIHLRSSRKSFPGRARGFGPAEDQSHQPLASIPLRTVPLLFPPASSVIVVPDSPELTRYWAIVAESTVHDVLGANEEV